MTTSPIKAGRPLLKLFAPTAYWNTMIFGWFNILLGIGMFLAVDSSRTSSPLIIVNEVLTFQFWGFCFVATGIFQLTTLRMNKYRAILWAHRVGTALKSAWAIALVIRFFASPGTLLIAIVWFTLMLLQIVTFIFLPIPNIAVRGEESDGTS